MCNVYMHTHVTNYCQLRYPRLSNIYVQYALTVPIDIVKSDLCIVLCNIYLMFVLYGCVVQDTPWIAL